MKRPWYYTDCPLSMLSILGEDAGRGVRFGIDDDVAYAIAAAHLDRTDCPYCTGLLASEPNRWSHEAAVRWGYAQPLPGAEVRS